MCYVENDGWVSSLMVRLDVVKDIKSVLEGVWSDGVFYIVSIISIFLMMLGRRNI